MLTKFLNNYGYMILGGAMILGFSAFKGVEVYSGKKLAPVIVYFHGLETDPTQVADESKWNTTLNGKDCNDFNMLACMIEVDDSDLNGTQLDSVKVSLDAIQPPLSPGYIPQHVGGSGSPSIKITNRD